MKTVSVGLGQGFVRCNCGGQCATKRCSCFEAEIGCNTKCHPNSTVCKNKKDHIDVEEESEGEGDEE